MKLIFGVMPCFNEMVLVKVWEIIDKGLEELTSLGNDHMTVNKLKLEILGGRKTLVIFSRDDEKDVVKAYVGFLITEQMEHSFHGYGIYVDPQYRDTDALKQVQEYFESTARKWTAPHATLCTNNEAAAYKAGYIKKYSFFEKKL